MSTPDERTDDHLPDRDRQVAIDRLCEHFAADRLSLEEFERRVDRAHQARNPADLTALLHGLPGPSTVSRAANSRSDSLSSDSYTIAEPDRVRDRDLVVAVLGGTGRSGRWSPARHNVVVSVLGGADLDFREAILPPGVTELHVYAFCGGVDVVVPPDLHVDCRGFAVLGGFDHAAHEGSEPDSARPTLRITGVAVLGGVDITVRRPGESARDARRRRRLERKERRKLGDGG